MPASPQHRSTPGNAISVAAANASFTYLTASRGFPADDAFIIRRRSRESMPSRDSAPANCTVTSANENDPSASSEKCRTLIHDSRSEEHTSELQSLMRLSYAAFCLKKKRKKNT